MRYRKLSTRLMLVMASLLLMTGLLVPVGTTAWTQSLTVSGSVSTAPYFCPDTVSFFITPTVFNTKSGNDGKGLTVHFIGGLPGGFTNQNVQLMEMRVVPDNGRVINAQPHAANENSGVVKFTGNDLVYLLNGMTGQVTFEVSGAAGGCEFAGTGTITVISPGGGPPHNQQTESLFEPAGDEALLEGDEGFQTIEDGIDEAGDLDENVIEEIQDGDNPETNNQPEQVDDLTPPASGLPETNQPEDLDELDDLDEDQTSDPGNEQAEQGESGPKPPKVKEIEQPGNSAPGTDPETIVNEDENQGSQPDTSGNDADPQGPDEPKGDSNEQQDDLLVKEPLTPVLTPEPVKPLPPVQPIQEIDLEKPADSPTRPGETVNEPDESESTSPAPLPPVNSPGPPPLPLPPVGGDEPDTDLPDEAVPPVDESDNDTTQPEAPLPPVDEHEPDTDDPENNTPPVDEPEDVVEDDPEPLVTCPVAAEVRFDLQTLDLADSDRDLRLTVQLPGDLPEDYSIETAHDVELWVKLGENQYGSRTAKVLPDAAYGPGGFRVGHADLVHLLDEYRGDVTLEVRGRAGDCDFAGTERLMVIETQADDEQVTEEPGEAGGTADLIDEGELEPEQQIDPAGETDEIVDETIVIEDDEAKEPDVEVDEDDDSPVDEP